MPEYLRVLDEDTGHKSSIQASQLPHGRYKVLRDEEAADIAGNPLPPVFAQAPAPGETPKPYLEWSKSDLENEVSRRNDARGAEDRYVDVESPYNKPQLAAALEADDINKTPEEI